MSDMQKLVNIGPVLEEQLHQAGINTLEELTKVGSRETWLRIQAFDPSACYNRLCGLEGAIRGMRHHNLPPEIKADLKAFYSAHRP